MSSVTSLETLPRELLWMIIDYAPEKVYDIRLSSSKLQSCIDEYASQRKSIHLGIFIDATWIKAKGSLLIQVPQYAANLFELRIKVRSPELWDKMKRGKESYGCELKNDCLFYEKSKEPIIGNNYLLDVSSINSMEISAFKECIGQELSGVCIESEKSEMPEMLKGIPVARIATDFQNISNELANQLLRTIKDHGADFLSIGIRETSQTDPEQFLLELSSVLTTLSVDYYCFNGEGTEFLGYRNKEWAHWDAIQQA